MAIMKTRVGRSMVGAVSAVLGALKQLVRSTSPGPGIDGEVLVFDGRQDVADEGGTFVAARRLLEPSVVSPMSGLSRWRTVGGSRLAVA
ncbi:MAG TPA: hypothetical protein VFP81_06880 [Propionibacteriaceae bacterium]|nr:hypothetical protein [Propionibacteriaceae bacterium]